MGRLIWPNDSGMGRVDRCDWCSDVPDELWLVNNLGGYGLGRLTACINCLRGDAAGCVPRLLEVYPAADAAALQEALNGA